MKRIVYLFICFSALLYVSFGCKSMEMGDVGMYIKFYYIDKGKHTEYAWSAQDLIKEEDHADTTFYDSLLIKDFMSMINKLEDDSITRSIDTRVVAEVHSGDSVIVVSFGEDIGTMVDGVRKEDKKELFDFIQKHLYNEAGYRRLYKRLNKCQSDGVKVKS